jgi:hypothetical protein
MRRLLGMTIFVLSLCLAGAVSASATTYYVATNGSDSNNGTSKTTPFLHAPGMSACTGTCGGTSLRAGDNVILRGGDTWHAASGSPQIGAGWTISWSGSSGNPIYIGVDKTWFAGGSWTRPILNFDNPLSTGRPGSCANDDKSVDLVKIGSQSFVTFDNFEFVGACWSDTPSGDMIDVAGNINIISNNYFHGWTYVAGSHTDEYPMIGGGLPNGNTMLCTGNVFDGSDASLGTTSGEATGFAILNTCQEVERND